MRTILALETSCDESAVAVLAENESELKVLASEISSQVDEHARWGGVVPEIASRRHLEVLPHLVEECLVKSGLKVCDFDAVAATVTPGLSGALMVGSVTGRTLAALNAVPFLGIHHLEGHLASVSLGESSPEPPYLVLLVSGGHTELIRVESPYKFERLGRSHDDAAGEAFDKVARLLGLSYPGGPAIEKVAENGSPNRFKFPKGRVSRPEGGFYPYDFSFSGLKTAVLRQVETLLSLKDVLPIADIAASFEQVVADVLIDRSIRCAIDHGLKELVMVGGVAANKRLRALMKKKASLESIEVYFAPKAFCTDNAAMVGAAALNRLKYGNISSSLELGVSPRWPLEKADLLYEQEPPF